jgi:ribosomal protein S18 acetylase RimI-like enzyme
MTSQQIAPEAFTYRSILPQDRERIKQLHEEFFPVKYSDAFYDGIIVGRGIYGGKLHSILAVDENQEVVAFLLGQFLTYPDQCEDRDLFSYNQPQCMYYILTIGVIEKYRRSGVASILVNKIIEYAQTNPSCGSVSVDVPICPVASLFFISLNRYFFM